MTTTFRKPSSGGATAPKGRASVPGTVSRTVLNERPIEKATDLGGGYLLVKVARSARGRIGVDSPPPANVPLIPVTDIEKLLKDARARAPAPAQMPARPLRSRAVRVKKTADEDNAELMARLDQGTLERRTKMRDQGLLLTSSEICSQLGITRQALSKAVTGMRMFYLDGASSAQWYPSFFVRDKELRREIETVSVALGELSGPMKFQFFSSPKHSLHGQTPVEAIEAGRVDDVLRSAEAFKERGLGR